MKKCGTCKSLLPDDSFPWKNQSLGKRQSYCKSCKSTYNKTWYQKHADQQKERARKQIRKVFGLVQDAKNVPCADCGVRYPPEVMDLDHVRGSKIGNVSSLANKGNIRILLAEISKCEVVCSNCHRLRTTSRRSQVEKAAVS